MRSARFVICCAVASAILCVGAPTAAAVVCGQPERAGGEPTVGTLALDTDNTPLETLDFKGDTNRREFLLAFKVSGCTITSSEGLSARARLASGGQASLGTVTLEPKGSVVVATIPVDPEKFDPGVAKPLLTITGESVNTFTVRLSMQRKEAPTWPFVLALIAALLGGAWALWVAYGSAKAKQKRNQSVRFNVVPAATAVVLGVAAGYAVYKGAYVDSETFELDFPTTLGLVVGVAAAAAGGATAGAEGALTLATKRRENKAEKAAAKVEGLRTAATGSKTSGRG